MKQGDVIHWKQCPPYLWQFATGSVTEISECGQFIKFGFIAHWVSVGDCEPCNDPAVIEFCQKYK